MYQNSIQPDVLRSDCQPSTLSHGSRFYHQLAQIAVIARYEYKMQWRRRALLVITLAMLLIAITPMFMLRHELGADGDLAGATGTISTSAGVSFLFIPIGAVLGMVIPFVMADVIPKDRQLGVSDLLNSTPLSAGTYLFGKLLGSWLSVGMSILAVISPTALVWYGLIGPLEPGTYIEPWIIGALPMIVINVGLVVLLSATQPDPRRAILIVVVLIVLIPAITGFEPRGDWHDVFNPLRPGLFFNYTDTLKPTSDGMLGTGNPNIQLISVEATIGSGLIQLGIVWVVIWRWLRRHMG